MTKLKKDVQYYRWECECGAQSRYGYIGYSNTYRVAREHTRRCKEGKIAEIKKYK